jgi:hypothetical protein
VRLEVWPFHLAIQVVKLMAENDDFDLLGFLGPQRKDDELKKATQNPVAKRQNGGVARTRLHGRRRLRHSPIQLLSRLKSLIKNRCQ